MHVRHCGKTCVETLIGSSLNVIDTCAKCDIRTTKKAIKLRSRVPTTGGQVLMKRGMLIDYQAK